MRLGNQKKDMESRDLMAIAVVGRKGSGKSSLLRDIALNYYQMHKDTANNKVLIHDASGSRAFADIPSIRLAHLKQQKFKSGIAKISIDDEVDENQIADLHKTIFKYFKNGLVILDEASSYISPACPGWQRSLLLQHRNKKLDIVYVFHSLSDIPVKYNKELSNFLYFKTNDIGIDLNYFIARKYANPKAAYTAYDKVTQATETDQIIQPFETALKFTI